MGLSENLASPLVTVEGRLDDRTIATVTQIFAHLDGAAYGAVADRILELKISMSGEQLEVYWGSPEPNEMEASLVNEAWEQLGHNWHSVTYSTIES